VRAMLHREGAGWLKLRKEAESCGALRNVTYYKLSRCIDAL
jgi:hypothetical protein